MNKKFYGQFNPPVDQYIFERFFPNLLGGVSLECGAYDGIQESSCNFFEESCGWNSVNIEASPPIYAQLVKNRPKSININAALSNRSGVDHFKHAIHPHHGENFGNGSLTHLPAHYSELVSAGCHFREYQVRLMTYGELLAETGLSRLDLFVLDVEGHELEVIEGMRKASVLPRLLCIEHGHFGVETICEALAGLPFVYDSSLHVNSFFVNKLLF